MDNQDSFAGRSYVNRMLLDLDIPVRSTEARYQFVVISRDVDYTCALAGFAQNFLDHVIVLLWPVNRAPQRPDINQIAHDVERVEVGLAQKVQQRGGVAAARAQMRVGNPRCSLALRSWKLLSRSAERETLLRVDSWCRIAS